MPRASTCAFLTATIVAIVACSEPELPPVAEQRPRLTEDDFEIIRTVLDQLLRPARDALIERSRGPNSTPPKVRGSFLIFDATIPSCLDYPRRTRLGCLGPEAMGSLTGFRITSLRLMRQAFADRHSEPLPIHERLGDDVGYIPTAIVDDRECFHTLLRKYPGAAIVVFSAPSYPKPRSAVIYYRLFWHGMGFVHLTRDGGRWAVVNTISQQE